MLTLLARVPSSARGAPPIAVPLTHQRLVSQSKSRLQLSVVKRGGAKVDLDEFLDIMLQAYQAEGDLLRARWESIFRTVRCGRVVAVTHSRRCCCCAMCVCVYVSLLRRPALGPGGW